jgi:hypothetical protein
MGDQMPVGGPQNNLCANAGGSCMSGNAAGAGCPVGYHQAADVPQASCGYAGGYGGGSSGCYAYAGPTPGYASLPIPCCVADSDAGDAGGDGASDAAVDAPASIGSCAGSPCAAGCACGLLPQSGGPFCLCVDAGSVKPDASEPPTCGSIYCYSGCSCADAHASSCTCP